MVSAYPARLSGPVLIRGAMHFDLNARDIVWISPSWHSSLFPLNSSLRTLQAFTGG